MSDYPHLTMSSKILFLMILFKVLFYSFTNADEYYSLRYKRAIGGESLDTSNFVLYIDPNGNRFIEVPEEYMNNWVDDQKMWRTWSIVLAILCFIFFVTLLFFLIHGFCTSTGPFANCTKLNNENSSDDKRTSSTMTTPVGSTQKDHISSAQQTYPLGPHYLSGLPLKKF